MDRYWIWFSRINKIGAKTQNELLKNLQTPERIYKLKKQELEKIDYLTSEQVCIILDTTYKDNLDIYEKYMNKHNIKMINIHDEIYPKKLKNIYDPPAVLYVQGNENILNEKSIAIIGSRACSKYGKEIAKRFAYILSKNNINVISGLAKGIDTYAHFGTISANKSTVAVLGNGLDIVYPAQNENLYKEIIEKNGAIISEYIVGTKPEKNNFPARNRIISGLSDGILVVEATEKSGTFITVDFALEQGKNVYAIPRKYR